MDHVLAQGAFIGRADPLEGVLGLLVPVMGLELDPDAAERLESVGEHQKLGLGIHRRSLIARVSQVLPISTLLCCVSMAM